MIRVHAAVPVYIMLFIVLVFVLTGATVQYEVSGVLVDQDQTPLVGLPVMLYNEGDQQLSSDKTDNQGRFRLVYQVEPTSAGPAGGPDTPPEYKLGASYPNPFNPRTTVPFDVPQTSQVTITVYTVLGRQVMRTTTEVNAGRHEIQVNLGGGLSQGQYLLRVQGDGFTLTQSMTFVSAGISGGTPGIRIMSGAGGQGALAGSVRPVQDERAYRIVVPQSQEHQSLEVPVPADSDHDAGTITVARKPDPSLSLHVSLASDGIDRVAFAISARDTVAGLSWVALDYGAGSDTVRVQGTALDTTLVRSYGGLGGHYNYRVTVRDGQGLELSEQGGFELTGLARVDLTWRGYLFGEPLEGGEVYFSHNEVDFDTTLVSDGQGRIQARLPRGSSYVLLSANPGIDLPSVDGEVVSNISRIKLSNGFLPERYESLFWHGGDSTFVLSGPKIQSIAYGRERSLYNFHKIRYLSDVSFELNLNKDLETVINFLENAYDATGTGSEGYLLEEMSRQTNYGMLLVPKVDEPVRFVHNWGDPNCPSEWRNRPNFQFCTEDIFPGIPIDEYYDGDQIKQFFSEYVFAYMGLANNSLVGNNVYEKEIISGDAEYVTNYINSTNWDNVNYFAHSASPTESGNWVRGPPYTMDRSISYVGINSASWFSNESKFPFSQFESWPVVRKSVRDRGGAKSDGADYPVVIMDGRVFYPKDELFHLIANGFGTYAQMQPVDKFKYFVYPDIVDSEKYSGFNIQLYFYSDGKCLTPESHVCYVPEED